MGKIFTSTMKKNSQLCYNPNVSADHTHKKRVTIPLKDQWKNLSDNPPPFHKGRLAYDNVHTDIFQHTYKRVSAYFEPFQCFKWVLISFNVFHCVSKEKERRASLMIMTLPSFSPSFSRRRLLPTIYKLQPNIFRFLIRKHTQTHFIISFLSSNFTALMYEL